MCVCVSDRTEVSMLTSLPCTLVHSPTRPPTHTPTRTLKTGRPRSRQGRIGCRRASGGDSEWHESWTKSQLCACARVHAHTHAREFKIKITGGTDVKTVCCTTPANTRAHPNIRKYTVTLVSPCPTQTGNGSSWTFVLLLCLT